MEGEGLWAVEAAFYFLVYLKPCLFSSSYPALLSGIPHYPPSSPSSPACLQSPLFCVVRWASIVIPNPIPANLLLGSPHPASLPTMNTLIICVCV